MKGYHRGIIAKGVLHESSTHISDFKYPTKIRDDLWSTEVYANDLVIGIKLDEARLTQDEGMITIETM